ncbi:MAG: 1-(5-phosphoribosyl)-5-[(5-phosphoribosylamino)methylideneamino]imidazole-4-carboxamide isomerase [Planctomycetes bacterium]|nr:1-(5-phosphoribosyl)-5-[(5-phosphoribosylamino)methylideneamino]imidazole-4-carboxamide isomerase [Planctomycetota bacterium]
MRVIPAVDIKGGKAVRLVQGKADQETVYDEDPVHAARRWADAGARRIHIVDLDGAFDGRPKNAELTFRILKEIKGPEIEIGGGLRSAEAVAELFDAGAARCVIGTKVVEDRNFLKDLANRHPGKLCVGLDAKDGKVVTKGWVEVSKLSAVDLIAELYDLPLGEVIYTDIDRDGMLQGPNLKRLAEMRDACPFPLIASGGVTTLENIRALRKLGCFGCIIGKALYDGRLELPQAYEAAGDRPLQST